MARGERIAELLAQPRFAPLAVLTQIALLAALNEGLLDAADPARLPALKAALPPLIAAEPRLAALRAAPSALDDATRAVLLDVARSALGR